MIFHQNFFYNAFIDLHTNCFGGLISYRKRFNVNLLRWRHFDKTSDLLFNSENTTLRRRRTNLKPGITIIPWHCEIKVMKRKLNFQNMFGNWKTKLNILTSNGVLLQKPPLIYVVVNAVTYAWQGNCLSLKLS